MNNLQPQLFPLNDDSYLSFNNIGRIAKGLWSYENKDGRIMFVVYRYEYKDKETGEDTRKYWPVQRINGNYEKGLGWDKRPIYKLPELIKTNKPILFVEGEWTCDSATNLFPDYFVTCWSGGCRNWKKTDWTPLKNKEDITFWPDNDHAGVEAVQHITRWLSDRYNIQAKIVKNPRGLPQTWDLHDYEKNDVGNEIDIRKLLKEAEPVKKYNYEDIKSDIENQRWTFIKKTRKLYWDKYKKEFVHRDTINELYLRDYDLKGLATKRLHKDDIDVVDATAFWPVNKEYLYEDERIFLNTYKQKVFDPLEILPTKDDIKVFRDHLKLVSNEDEKVFNWLEDTIAHDIQFPQVNRLWAVILQGDFGLGKSIIYEIITELMGHNNVQWVPTYAFSHKFRDWLKNCCVIVCNEFSFEKFSNENSSAYGMMRELITETKHFVESKGVDQYQHKGHYKIWLSSNEAVPIKLSPRDRRYFVVKIHKTKDIILEEDPNYYDKVWAFVEDDEKIKQLFWYYKSVHNVSNEFSAKEPLMTEAKSLLIAEGQSQVFRDLDTMLLNKEGPFVCDIVNSNNIINYVREKETGMAGTPNPRPVLSHRIDQTKITEWINYHQGVPIKKGNPVSITPGDLEHKRKARYHAIRNQGHWISCESLEELREHMKEKVEVLSAKQETLDIPF